MHLHCFRGVTKRDTHRIQSKSRVFRRESQESPENQIETVGLQGSEQNPGMILDNFDSGFPAKKSYPGGYQNIWV